MSPFTVTLEPSEHMPRHQGLLQRGTRWYANFKVPNDLQKALGKSHIRESLGTSDYREACRKIAYERARVTAYFENERRKLRAVFPSEIKTTKTALTVISKREAFQMSIRYLASLEKNYSPAMPAPVYLKPCKTPAQKPGRPCLLAKACEAKLLKYIEEGLPLKQAAALAGVSYDSINRWRIKGESEYAHSEFRDFCMALNRAKAVAMRGFVSHISKTGKTDWRAAAWMLERRHKEEFGHAQKVEHSGPGGKPFETFTTVEPEVLRRMRKQSGMVEVAAKLGAILLRNRGEKEETNLLRNADAPDVPRLRE